MLEMHFIVRYLLKWIRILVFLTISGLSSRPEDLIFSCSLLFIETSDLFIER